MSWQQSFAITFGPGLFTGTSFGEFWNMLHRNRFRVHPVRSTRLLAALQNSIATALAASAEIRNFSDQWQATSVRDPLIILGHWRSGTTHLHNLLCCDGRFAYPNLYQVMYPHIFLSTERTNTRLLAALLPETRFGLDNVRLKWTVPYEDEFALAASCRSAYLGWAWPRSHRWYDRYLTMRDAAEEVEVWKKSLLTFVQKLTFKYEKPLILKSPPHTCRIKLLLELFPGARFVHVHRNPYHVYLSRRHLDRIALGGWAMQSTKSVDWNARIFRLYIEMYDAFLDEIALIPAGRFHEVCFEELEQHPLDTVRGIYKGLQLPDFSAAEQNVRNYIDSLSEYRKNTYPDIPQEFKQRIAQEWGRFFDFWGYPT